jgi:hypothetical protein
MEKENDIGQQIKDRIAELPQDIQQAILSADFDKRVQNIASRHALHIDQMGTLGDETLLVMIGFSNPAEFSNHIVQQIHVSAEEAQRIATDINQEIFLPIRESMKKFAEEQRAGTAPAKSVIMPSAQAAADTKPTPMPPLPPKISIPPSAPVVQQAPKPPPPPPQKPEMHSAEVMLREKTVSAPMPATPPPPFVPKPPIAPVPPTVPVKPVPPKPTDYKADPYREPIEP